MAENMSGDKGRKYSADDAQLTSKGTPMPDRLQALERLLASLDSALDALDRVPDDVRIVSDTRWDTRINLVRYQVQDAALALEHAKIQLLPILEDERDDMITKWCGHRQSRSALGKSSCNCGSAL